MHQLTAFGGLHGAVPFQQAIVQSPGLFDAPSSFQQQQIFEKFLSLLKVKTIAEARKLPASSLIEANSLQIIKSDYGTYTYGIVHDGRFVPASAGRLLRQGWFAKDVKLIVSHTAQEGLFFTNSSIRNEPELKDAIHRIFPAISPNNTEYIVNVLYPPVFDGSYGYKNQFERQSLFISDFGFT